MYRSLLLLLSLAAAAQGRSDLVDSANQLASDQFKVCIDDSDCGGLEGKYACFQYICYPYENDNMIAREKRKTKCTKKEECEPTEVCFRHHDRRKIITGLCMEELGDCRENGERDCKGKGPKKCCNGQFCCEDEYFNQLRSLPCLNNLMCKDLGYGDFCCPSKGNTTSVCCNTDPHPPPRRTTQTPPKVDHLSRAGTLNMYSALSLVIGLLLPAFFW